MKPYNKLNKAGKAAVLDFFHVPHGLKPGKPRVLVDNPDNESHVVREVAELLAMHPRVAWACRFNSGAASYEAKSGKYAPLRFHTWLRPRNGFRFPDIYGMLKGGQTIAFEAKRRDWKKPSDLREEEQAAFLSMIRLNGGIAAFVTSASDVECLLR